MIRPLLPPNRWMAALLLGLLGLASLYLMAGSVSLDLAAVADGLFSSTPTDPRHGWIIRDIRLPRLLLALAVGFSLGLAGAALQGLLHNPLADPGVIGISAGAALGAVITLYYGLASLWALAVPAGAMAGALLVTAILALVALRHHSLLTLILAGVGLNALAGALTALAMNLSPNPFLLSDIVLWLLGSLANRSLHDLLLVLPFMAAGWFLLAWAGPGLRLLTLGEAVAQNLGLSLKGQMLLVICGAALAVGGAVAACGAVGFIGLVAPHLARPLVGHDPAKLLWPSGLIGAMLLTGADLIIRLAPLTQELRLGVVTALIGGPFFLLLILRNRIG